MPDLRDRLAGWRPHRELLEFACALGEADAFGPSVQRNLLLFFEKPYNWHAEYAVWEANGKPGAGDEGWDGFLEGLGEL